MKCPQNEANKEANMAKFMLGNYRHSLDEKNRFRIPVKFREGLGANPYYMPGKNGCLYIVPEERFEEMFAPFINQNPYTSDTDEFTSSVFAFSGPLEEDAQGRVALDKNIKEKYGISKELVFVGKATYLEVWPSETWDARYGVLDPQKIDKMIQDLKKYGV